MLCCRAPEWSRYCGRGDSAGGTAESIWGLIADASMSQGDKLRTLGENRANIGCGRMG